MTILAVGFCVSVVIDGFCMFVYFVQFDFCFAMPRNLLYRSEVWLPSVTVDLWLTRINMFIAWPE